MERKFLARTMFMLFFVFGFFAFACDVQAEECLSYEPAKVSLTGTIVEETFPGPPEYISIKDGDAPVTEWILKISESVCVNGNPNDEYQYPAEENVINMQLSFGQKGYERYKKLVNKKVIAEGTLFHAMQIHHRSRILLEVISIKSAEKERK